MEAFKTLTKGRITQFSFAGRSALSKSCDWRQYRTLSELKFFCDSLYVLQSEELSVNGVVECFSLLL